MLGGGPEPIGADEKRVSPPEDEAAAKSYTSARLIGSTVDQQGFLHEPFFLIGSGSLLNLAGMSLTFVLLLLGLFPPRIASAEER